MLPINQKTPVLTLDDLLDKFNLNYLLPFFLFLFLRGFPIACNLFFLSFAAPKQNHWCALPQTLLHLGWTSEQWIDTGIPKEKEIINKCYQYKYEIINNDTVLFSNDTIKCSSWEYDTSFYQWTVVQQFDLVCDHSWYISLSQSLLMFSQLIGNLTFSFLADRYGRKLTILIGFTLLIASSAALLFSTTFVVFSIIKIAIGIGTGCFQGVVIALGTETLSQSKRPLMIIFNFGFTAGMLVLPWIAYGLQNWIYIQVVLTIMPLVPMIFLLFTDESPCWLVATGRKERAETLFRVALTKSGCDLSTVPMHDVIDSITDDENKDQNSYKPSYLDFFKTFEIRRRALVTVIIFFTSRLLAYHLIFFSVRIGNDPFISFTLAVLFAQPGECFASFVIKKISRKKVLLASFIITAVAILCTLFLDENNVAIRIALVIIAKNFMNLGDFTSSIFAAELFPTVLRSMGIDGGYMAGRVGAMLSPFFKELAEWYGEKSAVIVSVIGALIGVAAVLAAPETYKKPLPKTIADLENTEKTEHQHAASVALI